MLPGARILQQRIREDPAGVQDGAQPAVRFEVTILQAQMTVDDQLLLGTGQGHVQQALVLGIRLKAVLPLRQAERQWAALGFVDPKSPARVQLKSQSPAPVRAAVGIRQDHDREFQPFGLVDGHQAHHAFRFGGGLTLARAHIPHRGDVFQEGPHPHRAAFLGVADQLVHVAP